MIGLGEFRGGEGEDLAVCAADANLVSLDRNEFGDDLAAELIGKRARFGLKQGDAKKKDGE